MSNSLGDQIKSAVNDALASGNFEELNSLLTETVTTTLNEVGATASKAWQQREQTRSAQWESTQRAVREQAARAAQQAREAQARREALQAHREAQMRQQMRERNAMVVQQRQQGGLSVVVKNKGMAAGVLFIVFGALANIPLFVCTLVGMFVGWEITGILFLFLLVSIYFICHGKSKVQLIGRAKRYVKLCGNKMYAEVEELAGRMGTSPKKVLKELRKILQKGIIPSARLDKKGTHLMLNDTVYKQYMDAENARLLREQEEKAQAKLEQKRAAEAATGSNTELEQMVAEGQAYIKKLRELNDLIPGEVISSKLYRMEELLKEIFQRVQKEPAQMNRMHKLMNYYLPTTLKLVEAYHEFDVVSTPGTDIEAAKSEIEATLDTINAAFIELLNSLFQDRVFDITTDAQVLQTMLASEGLTREMDMVKVKN